MHRDRTSTHHNKDHSRQEWGRPVRREHDLDTHEHASEGRAKPRRTHGVLRDEALRQIRELQARY